MHCQLTGWYCCFAGPVIMALTACLCHQPHLTGMQCPLTSALMSGYCWRCEPAPSWLKRASVGLVRSTTWPLTAGSGSQMPMHV